MHLSIALRRIAVAVVAVGLVAGAVVVVLSFRHHAPPLPLCTVSSQTTTYTLDTDQTANSTTIAAVGKRLGLPDHAVTVALSAALQESRLRNLSYGDRDSLGLFQQRPSQGWGTPTEILTPSYAAAAFFHALTRVPGWETLPVTVAAQKVQISGLPTAYAQWEPQARALAIALTGETAAGLTCRFALDRAQAPAPSFAAAMNNELGVSSLSAPFKAKQGWTVASWMVGHARVFRITTVSFAGHEWRASSGKWRASAPNDGLIRFTQQPGK
ncbi:MAG TPA: hypothetical protein VGP92_17335 [Acidimicrobiia bacterium]|jgi:hypothetical protein|nr:hypothetical protein [Acidimicrobiia bacterium]